MTPLEILATIFAVLLLAKISIFVIKPEALMKASEAGLRRKDGLTIICLILAAIVGYYVFASLDVVEVAAVMLFTSLLMSLFLLPFFDDAIKIRGFFEKRSEVLRKSWSFVIWVAIAVWVLYKVFV